MKAFALMWQSFFVYTSFLLSKIRILFHFPIVLYLIG